MENSNIENVTPGIITDATATATVAVLPAGYLATGYNATTEKGDHYMRPEYVRGYAMEIATALTGMKPSDFKSFIRELKRNRKSTLPFEARQTALYELYPKAQALVNRRKASPLLIKLVEANIDAVRNNDDWNSMYRHFEAIAGYLSKE